MRRSSLLIVVTAFSVTVGRGQVLLGGDAKVGSHTDVQRNGSAIQVEGHGPGTGGAYLPGEVLQDVLDDAVDGRAVFGISFAIDHGGRAWQGAAGDLIDNRPYFIASTTKLFTTAIILGLRAEGRLELDDPISRFLDTATMRGLHVHRGVDRSDIITIRHLLSHTSGLPDHFQDKGLGGKSLEEELVSGRDRYWGFEQAMERTKEMGALFPPGARGKAHYSDSNFQLLGRIIERITEESFAQVCLERIIRPLGLEDTYVYTDPRDTVPRTLYYSRAPLSIPLYMSAAQADGGVVSTSHDLMVFLRAFMSGVLFPKAYISELQQWERIFFPLRAGIGIHLLRIPWIMDPTRSVPVFIGHSGLSGALAFYSPEDDLYIVGTVNQVARPDLSFRMMIKLALSVRHEGR
jgi:CubicO group peptidase (beta-lactamase class C family)